MVRSKPRGKNWEGALALRRLFVHISLAEPETVLFSWDKTHSLRTVNKFPNIDQFNNWFTVKQTRGLGDQNKCTVVFQMEGRKRIKQYKKHDSKLMDYMFNNNIWLREH